MKLIDLTCPKCGAAIQVDADREFCFCSYCGAKSMIDNGTIHIVDEAKIKEAEAKIKENEALERMHMVQTMAQIEQMKQVRKSDFMFLIAGFALLILLFLLL